MTDKGQFPLTLPSPPSDGGEGIRSTLGGWMLLEYRTVTSTNLVSAKLPAWHAVRADYQTAGRGRFQRSWISDQGGLWLSAVVPMVESVRPVLPLLAGLAVCDVVRSPIERRPNSSSPCPLPHPMGERERAGLRMRWPNDVLVGRRKLAGLLIDQFVPGLAVVGIGVNVSNAPEKFDSALQGQTVCLAELVSPAPSLSELTRDVLEALRRIVQEAGEAGSEPLLCRINQLWDRELPVQLDLDGTLVTGRFEGVDAKGRLQLRSNGALRFFEPHQVRLLREIYHP